ncbi:MAG: ISNCY family transposase [Candidatus Aureabacteria bacterium]|nr:ISNCY family transposase [Candidatus Auribacterota bacterium]
MAGKDIVIMRQGELRRLSIIEKVFAGTITQIEAAGILDISVRQIRRIIKRDCKEGAEGIIHKSRGKPSHRAISKKIRQRVLKLCREKYEGFNPTFAAEKLLELDGIQISRETVRSWFIEEKIPYKVRKARPHRQWRERKQYFGERVQIDGSDEDWFEGRGPRCIAMGYIDDATNNVCARFYEYEGTIPAMDSFKHYGQKYGLPSRVYIDRHSTYKTQRKRTIEEQLANKRPLTQFGRALEELGVEVIYAHSPQAKGRVERLFRTFQDRLIKEMRLKGIKTIEEANRFLEYYLPIYNKRFSVRACKEGNLHRPIPAGLDLDGVLCEKTERALRNDFTVAHDCKLYQIVDNVRSRKVIVEKRLNGDLVISDKGRKLNYEEITQRPRREEVTSPSRPRMRWLSPMDHPWKKHSYKQMAACSRLENYKQKMAQVDKFSRLTP